MFLSGQTYFAKKVSVSMLTKHTGLEDGSYGSGQIYKLDLKKI